MVCFVCDKSDKWHEVLYRNEDGSTGPIHSKGRIHVCKECGNACFDVEPSLEDKVKEYYRKEYRGSPGLPNLITTTHKLNYIRVFLREHLQSLGQRKISVGEVGCATGYLLNFFRNMGHKVAGSEYTISFRRMSEHYYGIPLTEELDDRNRHDLIVLYHVFEHLVEPDKKLARYASMLNEDGRLLISVPEWFSWIEEASGGPTSSFEKWFHKDHINLFSAASLSNVFRKCGLIVVKEDHEQYGQTYLLRKAKEGELPKDCLVKEDWKEKENYVIRARRAIELYAQGRAKEALDVEPRYPEAWMHLIFSKAAKDSAKQADLFLKAQEHCGRNKRYIVAKGQWHFQREELDRALELFNEVNAIRPNEDVLMFMGYAYAKLGKATEAVSCFQQSCVMDPRKWAEAQSWILKIVSELPAWDERQRAQAKELLIAEAEKSGSFKAELTNSLAGFSKDT